MSTWTPGITVIIPTFKRPIDLNRCLAALEEQSLRPAEILIAYRAEDEATQAYLARPDRPGLRPVLRHQRLARHAAFPLPPR